MIADLIRAFVEAVIVRRMAPSFVVAPSFVERGFVVTGLRLTESGHIHLEWIEP